MLWKVILFKIYSSLPECRDFPSSHLHYGRSPVSILYKSIAGRYRPVRVADRLITARCRFIKNASWESHFHCMLPLPPMLNIFCLITRPNKRQTQHGLLVLLLCYRSAFLAAVQKGLLSLLGLHRIFCPCWCFKNFLLKNYAIATKQNGHLP